ncbi:hypothetical protein BH11ACT3_BH11ACT3_03690 [soil metagenome]
MSGEVSFDRPAGATVEKEFSGSVAAAADRVFADLMTFVDPGADAHFVTDRNTRRAVVQGDYWYRGEYLVEEVDGGSSNLGYTIVNVAPGWHVLGRLTGRKELRAAPRQFEDLLQRLGDQPA